MIKAYELAGMTDDAAQMFHGMLAEGAVAPNVVTVAVVLAACRDAAGDLVLGRRLEDSVKSAGIEMGSLVSSALVGMYEKCGEMAEARRVFDSIIDKDTGAWNVHDHQAGNMSKDAISLFHSMRRTRVRPDNLSRGALCLCCSWISGARH